MKRAIPDVAAVEHRYVEARGLRTHVAEAGKGRPVVMLHGWPQHWYEWRHLIPPLAERYRVICPDLRGFGWSDAPPDGYEKAILAADVLGVLDAMRVERFNLVGHDWGGIAGFLLCLRAPERVERFLALNTGHPWLEPRVRDLPEVWRVWYQVVLSSPGLSRLAVHPLVDLMYRFGVDGARVTEDEWATFAEQFAEPARVRATVQLYRSFLLRDYPAIARGRYHGQRLRTPTRFLHGTGDPVVTPRMLESARRHADDLTIEPVPDVGHFIADEAPELVRDRALDFFGP